MLGVKLGCFRGVMRGVMMMAVGHLGVMRGQMVIAGFVVPRGFAMMTRRVVMMFGCFLVMRNCLLGHFVLLKVFRGKSCGRRH
jgi:hypothetical protein